MATAKSTAGPAKRPTLSRSASSKPLPAKAASAAAAPAPPQAIGGNAWVPDRRDMIWIGFSPHVGTEMRDEHPMLVLSTKAFNERTGIVIGLPMTHAEFNRGNPFAVEFPGPKGEPCFILTHQPKSFDWRQRGARPHSWGKVAQLLFRDACAELESIISIG